MTPATPLTRGFDHFAGRAPDPGATVAPAPPDPRRQGLDGGTVESVRHEGLPA